jgi:hypothetical protein
MVLLTKGSKVYLESKESVKVTSTAQKPAAGVGGVLGELAAKACVSTVRLNHTAHKHRQNTTIAFANIPRAPLNKVST